MRGMHAVLPTNAGFFLAEIVAGVAAGLAALRADALDFFGDASNDAISLGVAGMVLTCRARVALAKGGTLIVFALWVAKVETSIGRYKRVIGDALRSRTDQTEATFRVA
jgi:Co/Zn/Cd efflux system component